MNTTTSPQLWSIWLDYFATGEGRSIMAVIGYASTEEQAKALFSDKFGDWFKLGCDAEPGVVLNPVTQYIFTAPALQMMTKNAGTASIVAYGSVHFNMS